MTDRDDRYGDQGGRGREPLLSAPPLAILFPVIFTTLYGLGCLAPSDIRGQIVDSYALRAPLVRYGYYDLLLTYMFVHGSWIQVLGNSAFCLVFATPLIRAMGRGWRGAVSFIAFFLVSGVAAGLGYCLLNWYSNYPILGASGAAAALIGAAIRLSSDAGGHPILPLWHPRVLIISLLVAVSQYPLVGGSAAWQAHIAGYLFGLILISPWMRLFHRHYFRAG